MIAEESRRTIPPGVAIIKSVVKPGHVMGLLVTAEGVETQRQVSPP
ncbi:hypothetical protein [Pantoea sp. WMus005]|nr:hypothetical protein [Pantoea sp. WMus005]NYS28707.1 hypothetical protein [Pantoea sp. WMus005]